MLIYFKIVFISCLLFGKPEFYPNYTIQKASSNEKKDPLKQTKKTDISQKEKKIFFVFNICVRIFVNLLS